MRVYRRYLYPYGDPNKLNDLRNRIAFLVAEGCGSYNELKKLPVTERERLVHYVVERIKRKTERQKQVLEGISKMLGG